jgi:peptide deformylase
MIYPIYIIGTDVLRQECSELPIEKNEELEKLIENMFETMHAASGVGLAAPQIGKAIKLFVIDATPLADDEPELKDFKKVFINAKITDASDTLIQLDEGCLSLPGIRENVYRHEWLQIQYYDENFEFHDERLETVKARIIQHEYDHIYGTVFTDRISKVKKVLLRNKLKAMAAGHFEADYKFVLGDKSRREQLLVRAPIEL